MQEIFTLEKYCFDLINWEQIEKILLAWVCNKEIYLNLFDIQYGRLEICKDIIQKLGV